MKKCFLFGVILAVVLVMSVAFSAQAAGKQEIVNECYKNYEKWANKCADIAQAKMKKLKKKEKTSKNIKGIIKEATACTNDGKDVLKGCIVKGLKDNKIPVKDLLDKLEKAQHEYDECWIDKYSDCIKDKDAKDAACQEKSEKFCDKQRDAKELQVLKKWVKQISE